MATRAVTQPRNALSIKAILVTVALALGVITLLAFVAGIEPLTDIYGFVGVVLIAQAAYYAVL